MSRPGAWSRRQFLHMLLAGGGGLLAACGSASATVTPSAVPTSTRLPTAGPTPYPSATSQPTATPTPNPTPEPSPSATPALSDRIQHIVFFIQENHTFDSLFAGFPGADGQPAAQACPDRLPADPPHQHADAFAADGATLAAARCSYREAAAPNYWKVARAFTLCDQYFSEVRGPSHPNYLMLTAAQSPIVNSPGQTDVCPQFCLDLPTLAQRLDERQLTWRDYGGILTDIEGLVGRPEVMDRHDEQFFADAAAGALPNVAWLNSAFLLGGDAKSGHPPASLCAGENYAVRVLNAVMEGPQWPNLALFLVWDDWGGFYDHVEPPSVELWQDGTSFRYGHRVPCLVISPYARGGFVAHTQYSHVSLLRFAETVFGLAPLTERDAAAADMLDCFDLSQSPLPPLTLAPRQCPA